MALFLLAAAYDGGFARSHLASAEVVLFAFAREHECAGPQIQGPAVSSRRASRAALCNSTLYVSCPLFGRGWAGETEFSTARGLADESTGTPHGLRGVPMCVCVCRVLS